MGRAGRCRRHRRAVRGRGAARRPPAPGAGSSPFLLARRRVYARRGGAERARPAGESGGGRPRPLPASRRPPRPPPPGHCPAPAGRLLSPAAPGQRRSSSERPRPGASPAALARKYLPAPPAVRGAARPGGADPTAVAGETPLRARVPGAGRPRSRARQRAGLGPSGRRDGAWRPSLPSPAPAAVRARAGTRAVPAALSGMMLRLRFGLGFSFWSLFVCSLVLRQRNAPSGLPVPPAEGRGGRGTRSPRPGLRLRRFLRRDPATVGGQRLGLPPARPLLMELRGLFDGPLQAERTGRSQRPRPNCRPVPPGWGSGARGRGRPGTCPL